MVATDSRSLLLVSSLMLLLSSHAAAVVSITSMRTISGAHITKVVLSCPTSNEPNVTLYYRRVKANRELVITETTPSSPLSFDLTPDIEGYYYCEVDGMRSNNEVELVAYPTINPEIRAQTVYSTPTGDHAIIHCPYKPGVLLDRYSVSWFRGFSVVNTLAPAFHRHRILDNFSLVINNTVPDDAKAYACNIAVNISGDIVKKYGPAVSLEVTDPIRIIQPISDVSILPGQDAVFTCTAVGVPQPHIKWLIGSKEVTGDGNLIISSIPNSISVKSTLRQKKVTETDTGPVSCVAYHSYNGELFLAASTSNLVILTDNFTVTLTSETNGNVRIQATLPAVIPGVFSLIVKFIFNIAIVQQREIIHPSFKNTKMIDISIPKDQLPQFRQFGVSVALKFDDVIGQLTPETEKITLPNELPSSITGSDCECPQFPDETSRSLEGTITQVLLGTFLVVVVGLFIVGSILLGLCVHHIRKKQPLRSLTGSPYFHESESVKGDTLTRSVSRASYNSDSSRSSGRSSKSHSSGRSSRSSRSSRSGSSRRSSHSGSSHGTWSQADLDSVREVYAETDSLKHKELAQWGDQQQEHHSSSVAPDPDRPVKNRFQPPTSREEVFHTSLPHATNPIQFTIKYEKKKLRHSDSSFEDLELDNGLHFQPPFQTK